MNPHRHEHHADAGDNFSSSVAGLPAAVDADVLDLADGDTILMNMKPLLVALELGGQTAGPRSTYGQATTRLVT